MSLHGNQITITQLVNIVSGSHWTLNLVHFLLYDGPLDEYASHRFQLLEFENVDESYQKGGRRLLASHFPPKYLPDNHFANDGKTILVVRNPKDAVVSMYYMMLKQSRVGDFKMSWDLLLKYWLNGESMRFFFIPSDYPFYGRRKTTLIFSGDNQFI